jgi:hypothetical protein
VRPSPDCGLVVSGNSSQESLPGRPVPSAGPSRAIRWMRGDGARSPASPGRSRSGSLDPGRCGGPALPSLNCKSRLNPSIPRNNDLPAPRRAGRCRGATDGSVLMVRATAAAVAGVPHHPSSAPGGAPAMLFHFGSCLRGISVRPSGRWSGSTVTTGTKSYAGGSFIIDAGPPGRLPRSLR